MDKKFIHDLNNQLAIIEAFLSVIDPEMLHGDEHQLYVNAQRSFRSILHLIEQAMHEAGKT